MFWFKRNIGLAMFGSFIGLVVFALAGGVWLFAAWGDGVFG